MTTAKTIMENYPMLWDIIELILTIVVTAVVVSIILRLEKKASERILQRKNDMNLRFVESIARFILIFLAVQWVIMSSSITQPFGRVLFQGTTVIAAIAGFAAQPVIADMICGLMLSTTKPFNIGDRIELEDGTAGIVKDITMRHVVVEGIDTVEIIIPNSRLNAMKVTNMSYHTKTRSIHFRFNVSYDTDVEMAKAVIRRAVEESPYTIPGKPGADGDDYGPVYFIQYADSSLVMSTTVYYEPTNPSERVKSDINTRVWRALKENGIEIPYNYINVNLKK